MGIVMSSLNRPIGLLLIWAMSCLQQKWRRGHKAWRQGHKKKKKSEAKAKDSPSEDRPSRGQGQECSRPRTKDTGANVLKKKVFQRIFQTILKKGLRTNFSGVLQYFNNSKNSAVLKPRTGQFSRTWGYKAKDFKICPRGQGRPQGLHLWFTDQRILPLILYIIWS